MRYSGSQMDTQGVTTSVYSRLARQAAEYYVKQSDLLMLPRMLPPDLLRQRACYISIIENPGRRVRSMYGQALPQQVTLAQEIVMNTIMALTRNPTRKVSRSDLTALQYSVALLGPLQRITDTAHLDPTQFGLSVQSDRGKSALLLPNRAGVDTVDDQIATAMRESGINPGQEAFTMYRFSVEYDDG